ncbi:MAG: nuclear transport factor 2 family protein [Proteobacteria bacterium]|nr:nuclear transport factor 2 family protein [Pseudomonadota bacterium]
MMNILKSLLTAAVFIMIPGGQGFANEEEGIGAPCVVDAYLHAREQTLQANASIEDVDHVMEYVTLDLVYEHPRFGIQITGADAFREGLTSFLGATDEGRIEVIDYLVNGQTVAITFTRIFKVQVEDELQERQVRQLTVFEVRDGKIARIIDYW